MKWNDVIKELHRESPYDYDKYIDILKGAKGAEVTRKIKALLYVIRRIVRLRLFDDNKIGLESMIYGRMTPSEMICILEKYDVISFDVFDTLILRRVMDYTDVYTLVGIKLHINGFRRIRLAAEQEAIRRKKKTSLNDNVNIYDIYSVIQEWYGVTIELGVQAEIEIELAICKMNPYFKDVYNKLLAQGKKIVIISDMYFTRNIIFKLLENCGYSNLGRIFVSCECGFSKRKGDIFKFVEKQIGVKGSFIHVGDNRLNDIVMAQRNGWKALYYRDVNSVARRYRQMSRCVLPESIQGGLINSCMHNGVKSMTSLEEVGFIYFGPLYVGYCQWLNKLAINEKIDKIVFSSRDSYLLYRAYNQFYEKCDNQYVYVSRYALSRITTESGFELFINQIIEPRVFEGKYSFFQVLKDLDLENIIIESYEYDIDFNTILNYATYRLFKTFLYDNRFKIKDIYRNEIKAAEVYFSSVIDGCNRIMFVDVGWNATCFLQFKEFLKNNLNWNGTIIGTVIGFEGGDFNIEAYVNEEIKQYVFSPNFNSYIYKKHNTDIGNITLEIAFSAPEPSLKRYSLNSNKEVEFIFRDEAPMNIDIVKDMQTGIWNYMVEYYNLMNELQMEISLSPDMVYVPIIRLVSNSKFIKKILRDYKVQRQANSNEKDWKSIKEI